MLEVLNLTSCKIGFEGAEKLKDGIAHSKSLLELNLTSCDLGYEGLVHIRKGVQSNETLQRLILCDNELREESAIVIEKILRDSSTLNYLNLSWNYLNTLEASNVLFSGFLYNDSLVEIDLSANFFGKECLKGLDNYLTFSNSIRQIDFTSNLNINIFESLCS